MAAAACAAIPLGRQEADGSAAQQPASHFVQPTVEQVVQPRRAWWQEVHFQAPAEFGA